MLYAKANYLFLKYSGRQTPCKFARTKVASKMVAFKKDTSYGKREGNEKWLEEAVGNVGPVSVCIYVSNNFMGYKSGKTNFF